MTPFQVGVEVLQYLCCSKGSGELLDRGELVCDSFEGTWLLCCWCSLWGIYPKDFFYHWGLVVGLAVSFLLVFEVILIE